MSTVIRPRSIVTLPCPRCGQTPQFTQGSARQIGKYNAEHSARMECHVCEFGGEYGSINNVEYCIALWNKAVAHDNRRFLDDRGVRFSNSKT